MAGQTLNELKEANSHLQRTQVQLANDLEDEKLLVRNLMGTIKNYEKLLRSEGQVSYGQDQDTVLVNEHSKREDSWGILCSSIVLLDEECMELTRTVARMLEECAKCEKLHEYKSKKICHLNMRIERLDSIVFGQKIDC